MNLAIPNRTFFRAVSFAICLAGTVPNPSYGQARQPLAPAAESALEAQASSAPAEILRQLRKRDARGALETLAVLVDRPVSISDLVYSGLPSAAAGLHRSLAQMSADERYELLYQWSLPAGEGETPHGERIRVRLLAAAVPTDAPPKVFARSLGERPRDSTFAVTSIGPVQGFFCRGWMLAQAADELGRLARLRSTLEKLAESNVDGSQELLMLAYLAGSRGELERVQTFLHESVDEQGGETPAGLQPKDMTGAAIASAALLHEKLQPLGESLLKKLVDQAGVGNSIALRPFLRIAQATAAQVHRGKSPPEVLFRNRLKHWVSATVRSASDIDRGRPNAVWLTHEQHVLHLSGGTADVLFCRFPIVGEFDFVCETQEGGAIGTDGGLVYGGLQFQALGRKNTLTVWDADVNQMVTKPSPFARHDTAPVFNRVSIRSAKDGPNFESNFHPVWFDGPAAHSSPWLGLRSSGTKRPVFRNIRLSGNPDVPREVHLTTDGDQLRGWQAGFFGETLPSFHSRLDAGETSGKAVDWRIESGEVISSQQTDASNSEKPGWLRYQRPLLDGESISYEFLHRGDDAIVHPTIGRLAFLLEPTGVRVRWITTGELEWSGLEADNAALEPLNRRGPKPLPLREKDWNSLRVELSDNKVLITLNDQLIYQRPVDPNSETQFGLYRPTRNAEARVRQVLMTGDWPEAIPADFIADPVDLVATTPLQ